MRRIQLMLLALVMFQFACEPEEEILGGPGSDLDHDYDHMSQEFHDMFRGSFGITESLKMASIVERSAKRLMVKLEVENIWMASENYFANQFNTADPLDKSLYPVPPLSSTLTGVQVTQTLNQIIDSSAAFNVPQKAYIKSLSKHIMQLKNYRDGSKLVESFRMQVIQSKELSYQDKILLLELAAGSEAFLEFIEQGGIESVRERLIGAMGSEVPFGKVAECSVNWRNIWIGAIVGLSAGAVSGAYAGATVGTVTVPILGTAVGALGGAVFAGAAGFTSGVVYGIATDLISSCSRSGNSTLQQTYTSCEEAWEAYMTSKTNTMPSECFMVEVLI